MAKRRRRFLTAPVTRRDDGTFAVRIGRPERAALRDAAEQLRDLLAAEDPSSDEAVARLFPPAHPDDVIANLQYEHDVGDELRSGRLAAADTLRLTADAEELTEEQILAWLDAITSLRLVLGTRLGVTEESVPGDFADGGINEQSFAIYAYLTWLQETVIDALQS